MFKHMDNCEEKKMHNDGMFSVAYLLTVLGAIIYYIQHSASFWGGVLGFLKGLIWPLFATIKILELLKM